MTVFSASPPPPGGREIGCLPACATTQVEASQTADTPPLHLLLRHWREMTAKGQTIGGWGLDRAEAILGYIAELEALCEQLSSTIQWNRERHAEEIAEHRKRGRALTEALKEAGAA